MGSKTLPLLFALVLVTGCTMPGAADTPATEPADAANAADFLLSAWLCQDPVEVDDYNTSQAGGLTCSVSAELDGDTVVVSASGIPNHDLESGPGCCASAQDHTWRIPVEPTPDTDGEWTMAPERGPIAVALNGVAIYGPEDGPGGDAVASHYGVYEEDRQEIWLGLCDAHAGPGGEYHYHADGNCQHWHPDAAAGETWADYSFDQIDATEHSPLIGFAFDGYPIYGTYAWNEAGDVVAMTSSYRLKDGATGYNGIDDYEFVEGLGDLDECNGREAVTPDYPDGTYAYYSTRTNGAGEMGFPYFLLCYHGIADETNFDAGGPGGPGPGGPGPGGPGGPSLPSGLDDLIGFQSSTAASEEQDGGPPTPPGPDGEASQPRPDQRDDRPERHDRSGPHDAGGERPRDPPRHGARQ